MKFDAFLVQFFKKNKFNVMEMSQIWKALNTEVKLPETGFLENTKKILPKIPKVVIGTGLMFLLNTQPAEARDHHPNKHRRVVHHTEHLDRSDRSDRSPNNNYKRSYDEIFTMRPRDDPDKVIYTETRERGLTLRECTSKQEGDQQAIRYIGRRNVKAPYYETKVSCEPSI